MKDGREDEKLRDGGEKRGRRGTREKEEGEWGTREREEGEMQMRD